MAVKRRVRPTHLFQKRIARKRRRIEPQTVRGTHPTFTGQT